MNLGRNIIVWAARHALALMLIILILLFVRFALPPLSGWIRAEVETARSASAQQRANAEARSRFTRYAAEREAEARSAGAALGRAPEAELRQRRAAIPPAIIRHRQSVLSGTQLALAAASGNSDRVFSHYRAGAEIALLQRELRLVEALLRARSMERRQESLQIQYREAAQQLNASRASWQAARARADAINRRPLAGARNFVCRSAPNGIGCQNYRQLVVARGEMEAAAERYRDAQRRILAIRQAARAQSAADSALQEVSSIFDRQSAELSGEASRLSRVTSGNWVLWAGGPILQVLPTALAILAAAIFAPMLIKAFLYFAIAPVAASRPPFRLIPGERASVGLGKCRSAASQKVLLEPGHELLVVPEAVQATPHHVDKRTKWLLSWRMPFSSLASGMVALVAMRAGRADSALISATRDPLAEVALIELARGSAMVVRPRALRGLVQPIENPVRISRHWRLGQLSAWLTLQFRYLVFHGPCTLIVQGTRGVRLEPARSGRGVNQAATLGFSAGLPYSVSRSEAFGPYLLGKQELFNDSFGDGPGFYLYEEMPRDTGRGGIWGRGLGGLGDAALKIFGL